jgi:hypothetical protein
MTATGLEWKASSMHLLLGLRPPQQPLSDAALMLSVRKGEVDSFRHLYRRHYAAVQAYAFQCMAGPLQAQDVTAHVFAGLLQQMLAGESLVERRYPGCLRPHLLGNVRTTAVARRQQDPEALSPDFREWVEGGSRWPWGEDGQLTLAFERLPASTQRLLWHSVVERDAPALTARITGLDAYAVPAVCDQARGTLRQARTDLYLDRLERRDCRDAIRRLAVRPEAPPDAELAGHLSACTSCMSVYKDLARLDKQLEAQLPVRLLGWWTGEPYLQAKAAIPVPMSEPPFLARLLERARSDVPAGTSDTPSATAVRFPWHRGGPWTSPPVPRRFRTDAPTEASAEPSTPTETHTTAPGRHRRKKRALVPHRTGAAFAAAGFLAGVGAGMLLPTACEDQRGPQPLSPSVPRPSHDPDASPSPPVSAPPGLSGLGSGSQPGR